jgi:hypothetical protein
MFTGAITVTAGEPSTIEIGIPRALLSDPATINLAVISTDRSRAHTAGDIMGTDFTPADWTEALVLDTFVSLSADD